MGAEGRLEKEEQVELPVQPATAGPIGGSAARPLPAVAVAARGELDDDIGQIENLPPHIQAMIKRMMDGTEPNDYGHSYDVAKFNPAHINICVLRAAGFKGSEVSQIMGVDPQRVYQTMIHPYAKKLVRALTMQNSGRVIDIRTRIDDYAGELLDRAFGMAMKSEELKEVKEVTFGLLDRAGYTAKNHEAPSKAHENDINADKSVLNRLSRALDGSRAVDEVVMPTFVQRRPPEESFDQDHPAAESSSVGDEPVDGQDREGDLDSQRARGAA